MFIEPDLRSPRFRPGGCAGPRELPRRIALVGNFLPRLCGLATYTTHVWEALRSRFPATKVDVYAMVDPGRSYDFPPAVVCTIAQDEPDSYRAAARAIEASGAEMLWLQHEFGIYGGPAGRHIFDLLDHIRIPVQVTLHTVLEEPNDEQRAVIDRLAARARTLVVMAETGRRILEQVYDIPGDAIAVIPHGVPDRPYVEPDRWKHRFGLDGLKTILTFGLLSPGKGIETIIAALPAIIARCPQAHYVVLGATHPNLVAHEGERYRESLHALACRLGVESHVQFVGDFVGEEELIRWLSAADVYVTPYLNPAQITSGTLAYAFGLGKPVVSTPYAHAAELLADGFGWLVNFADTAGFGAVIGEVLSDDPGRSRLARKVYRRGRDMTWGRVVGEAIERFTNPQDALVTTDIPVPIPHSLHQLWAGA